jgi:hypothetical protein
MKRTIAFEVSWLAAGLAVALASAAPHVSGDQLVEVPDVPVAACNHTTMQFWNRDRINSRANDCDYRFAEGSARGATVASTRNELVHGSEQLHDLATNTETVPATQDQDWYLLAQQPLSSYEIVVDSTSARIGGVIDIDRLDSGGTVVGTGAPMGAGFTRSMRWQNTGSAPQTVRIKPSATACNPACGSEDVYRIRLYETSYGVPRFNNTNGQVTVLLIQNPSAYPISGTIYFWSGAGTQLANEPFSLAAKQLLSLALPGIPALANLSGSITVTHDGRYGDLAGKAVSLEAATGFTFDTLMVPRPR